MIETIRLDPKLEKCLAALKKGGRRACLAAERVEVIIAALNRGETPTGQVCAFTLNGEARIKGCRKYNLGAGYRMITLKQGNDLYLLFAGTHDQCARWIENNRDHLPLEMIAGRSRSVRRAARKMPGAAASPPPKETEPEEDWIASLDERDLRMVFCGLIGGE